jgi:ribonuclease HI
MQKAQMIKQFFYIKNQKIHPKIEGNNIEYMLKFDGCSKGNPGPAGAGAVLYHNNAEIWTGKKFVGKKETNNYAEYCGLLLGLKEARERNIRHLKVCGDSMLVIKQMNGEYKVKSDNIIYLYTEAKKIEKSFDEIIYEHIYREHNSKADELSNRALEDRIFIDEFKTGF